MKALSVRQPWAWAIVQGYKTVENRSWLTQYRGPILIHAAKAPSRVSLCESVLDLLMLSRHTYPEMDIPDPDVTPNAMAFGSFVGTVEVVDMLTMSDPRAHASPYYQGGTAWLLGNAKAFDRPIPFAGRQGLFDVPWPLPPSLLAGAARAPKRTLSARAR